MKIVKHSYKMHKNDSNSLRKASKILQKCFKPTSNAFTLCKPCTMKSSAFQTQRTCMQMDSIDMSQ